LQKGIVYIIIFIFLCVISNYSSNFVIGRHITNQSPYYLSFASIGAIYLESRLDCWAKINTTTSEQEIQDYLLQIMQGINHRVISDNMQIESNNSTKTLFYKEEHPEEKFIVTIKSDNISGITDLMFSIISQKQQYELQTYVEQLIQIPGLKWKFYYLYQGEIPYKLTVESREKLINVILKNMNARENEVYKENGVISTTAYSPVIAKEIPGLNMNGIKYNIQIAMTNSSQKNKTVVYIGSPLILGEY
jgi:hypothetical protein